MEIGRTKCEDSKIVLMDRARNVTVKEEWLVFRHFEGAYALMLIPLKEM